MKVYDLLKAANKLYIKEIRKNPTPPGMCWCLKVAAAEYTNWSEMQVSYRELLANIPEFNPTFLKATRRVKDSELNYWWDLEDIQSRLGAFQLLKSIYRHSNKKFVYSNLF